MGRKKVLAGPRLLRDIVPPQGDVECRYEYPYILYILGFEAIAIIWILCSQSRFSTVYRGFPGRAIGSAMVARDRAAAGTT